MTDQGSEYSGAEVRHPYQLFPHLNDIEHSRTKARHPQTNGCTERLNQIIQEEFYAVAFRKTRYTSIAQMQVDLDTSMKEHNTRRTNSGKRFLEKTPKQTLDDGYDLYKKYVLDSSSVDGGAIAEARQNPLTDFGSQSQLEDECSKSQNLQNQKPEVIIEELMHKAVNRLDRESHVHATKYFRTLCLSRQSIDRRSPLNKTKTGLPIPFSLNQPAISRFKSTHFS